MGQADPEKENISHNLGCVYSLQLYRKAEEDPKGRNV